MKFNENTYELIERYLNNELKDQELKDFEDRKNSDQAFAEEVEMSVSMKEFLSDSPENELRKNLQTLNEQFEVKPGAAKNSSGLFGWIQGLGIGIQNFFDQLIPAATPSPLRYAVYLIPILFLLGLWWFRNSTPEPEFVETPPTLIDTLNPIVPKTNEVEATPPERIVTEEKVPILKDDKKEKINPQPKIQKETPNIDLYAANFTPNPSLDFLIDNNLRKNEFTFDISKKMQDVKIKSLEDATPFIFSGKINSSENLIEKEIKVYIFSNNKLAYSDFTPISTKDLKLEKLENDNYQFNIENYYVFVPGLYYYILEDKNERMYYINKFKVENE